MRDSNDGMIEIVEASRRNEAFFVTVAIVEKLERKQFSFEVTHSSYKAVRRILQSRPLETLPGVKYRYFWDGSMSRTTESTIALGIRCETERGAKKLSFDVPHRLAANLRWFSELESLSEAEPFMSETE